MYCSLFNPRDLVELVKLKSNIPTFNRKSKTRLKQTIEIVNISCEHRVTRRSVRLCSKLGSAQAGLKIGQLGSADNACLGVIFGVFQHVRACTPRFYISRTAEPIALIFGM